MAVDDIDQLIGRGHADMRTPLDLQRLSDQGLAVRLSEDAWALTPEGLAWLERDRGPASRSPR